ncbi:MAG: hypothetical protein HFE35_07015 [Clostridia bacterium]|nr:hypothetical protein [Clostridia bacterium]
MKTKTIKKGLISLALCLCFALAALVPAIGVAQAKSAPNQEPTDYLMQTLAAMDIEGENFVADATYSHDLTPNGLEYVFSANGASGYALMLREEDAFGDVYYDITELFFDCDSPFANASGKKIYIAMFTYFEHRDGKFFDLTSKNVLTDEQIAELGKAGFKYFGEGTTTTVAEEIVYAKRNNSSYDFPNGLPGYSSSNTDNRNSCGPSSGSIVVGYYDYFYPNLVPNYSTTYVLNNRVRYYPQSAEIDAVIDTLYSDMNASGGVTFSSYKAGLEKYVKRNGYSVSYTSVMSGFNLDYSAFKNKIAEAQPVVFFLNTFNLTSGPVSFGEYDKIAIQYSTATHVMTGYGYRQIEYYNANNVIFRIDNYVSVSSALSPTIGYMRLNDNMKIDHAIAVDIY